jgi:4-hydroxybenzoyl-CoA reductase subunit beta
MRLPEFRYYAAPSLMDAAAALLDRGEEAVLLAGGTDVVPNMKRRQQNPALLIGIRHLPELCQVTNGAGLTLGACLRLADVAGDTRVRTQCPALAIAAGKVATPQLRNMGTLGGNLCLDTRCNYYNQNYEWRQAIDFCMKAPASRDGHACTAADGASICWVATSSPRCWAVSSTDTAPALIALGARVVLASADGERDIPLEELYNDDGMAYLAKRPHEILTRVVLTAGGSTADGCRSTYWKLRRRGSFDFPVLSVAAAARFGKESVVEDARIVLGAVASRPILVPESASLVGKALTDDAIEAFAESASRYAKPLDNTDFELGWRKKTARAYLSGALKELRGDSVRRP